MAAKKGGLGRGLDALFEDSGIEEQSAASAVRLRVLDVEPNKEQPRRDFDEAALADLSRSIAEHGVLQPILVRPLPGGTYQIIAGERRWRATRAAGLSEIPAVVKEMSDAQAQAAALIENLQREDLNPVEEARGIQKLMDDCGFTQEDAAKQLGKSRPAVANALRLLRLPATVLELLRGEQLSGGHARTLLALEAPQDMERLATEIVTGALSVRETERLVKQAQQAKPDPKQRVENQSRRAVFFDEVELSLSEALGRKIKVVTVGKEESGKLMIDFYAKEDLQRIANALRAVEG
ncbi:MAG: ParB/RepB/Spo0J family partition protein [Oscillospiraceae bacterium]|jgi:ParB family chromosome partitioning protein|nr:ParB/RepB/Spo0J family partition protein [Oscillospiraceae bacterium]